MREGGTIASQGTAEYLFSEDATCPDTLRVFESKDYSMDKVTVFHSLYLSACEKVHSHMSVCIGHYVLPPAHVQQEIRAVFGRFIWEQEYQMLAESTPDLSRSDQKEEDGCCEPGTRKSCCGVSAGPSPLRDAGLCCAVQHYPVNNMLAGYVSIVDLKKYSGELHDFIPGHRGSYVTRGHTCRPGGATEIHPAGPTDD